MLKNRSTLYQNKHLFLKVVHDPWQLHTQAADATEKPKEEAYLKTTAVHLALTRQMSLNPASVFLCMEHKLTSEHKAQPNRLLIFLTILHL